MQMLSWRCFVSAPNSETKAPEVATQRPHDWHPALGRWSERESNLLADILPGDPNPDRKCSTKSGHRDWWGWSMCPRCAPLVEVRTINEVFRQWPVGKVDGDLRAETLTWRDDTDPRALAWLAVSADRDVRRGVAMNPAAPASVLRMLAEHGGVGEAAGVAENPAAPVDALEMVFARKSSSAFVQDYAYNDYDIDEALGNNPSAPLWMVTRQLQWDDAIRRSGPEDRASTLVSDLQAGARTYVKREALMRSVAANRSAPPELLGAIARYTRDGETISRLVANPATDVRTVASIEKLWNGLELQIRVRAGEYLANVGVHLDNQGAVEFLATQHDWSVLTPESPEIALALALHPNP